MPELTTSPLMYDKTPLFKNPGDQKQALKLLTDMNQSMAFFKMLLDMSEPQKSDAFTHLGLMESYMAELSKLTGYNGMVAEENNRRYADLRKANLRIHELESQIGSQVSAQAVSAGIQHWENVFRAWYEATGFHYADVKTGPYVIRAEFDSELLNEPGRHIASEEIFNKIAGKVPFITTNPDWDIEHDRFHSNLQATENNRVRIIARFRNTFMNAKVHEFRLREDHGSYYLNFGVVIPWADLDEWYETIEPKSNTSTKSTTESTT